MTTTSIIVNALDWEKNVDPNFKDSNYLEPIVSERGRRLVRQVDRLWQKWTAINYSPPRN